MRSREALLLVASLALATGCVTRGSYEAVADERDVLAQEGTRLAAEVARLETANGSLSAERIELIDEIETMRGERDSLDVEASGLRVRTRALSKDLEVSQSQAAVQHAELGRLRETYQGLVSDLESEVAAGQIQIEQLRGGVRVNVSDDILFESGSARLDEIGGALLRKVADRLVGNDYRVEVQGHTDNVVIRGALAKRYPTNWELAGARASRVVRMFERAGVEGTRLTAVSHAEYQPVAPNDSVEDRWRNRRIEIRLHPVAAPVDSERLEPEGAAEARAESSASDRRP